VNIEQLRKELEIDEGVRYEIYNDHLGFATFGIGHLITESDPEHGFEVGTAVSEERCASAFAMDIQTVLSDCERLYEDFNSLPEEAQLIIANMMFNLGYPRLSKFKGMKKGVDNDDFTLAADEMVDSVWYHQVGARSKRLVVRMRCLTSHSSGFRDWLSKNI